MVISLTRIICIDFYEFLSPEERNERVVKKTSDINLLFAVRLNCLLELSINKVEKFVLQLKYIAQIIIIIHLRDSNVN